MTMTARGIQRTLKYFQTKAWKRACMAHNKRMSSK